MFLGPINAYYKFQSRSITSLQFQYQMHSLPACVYWIKWHERSLSSLYRIHVIFYQPSNYNLFSIKNLFPYRFIFLFYEFRRKLISKKYKYTFYFDQYRLQTIYHSVPFSRWKVIACDYYTPSCFPLSQGYQLNFPALTEESYDDTINS